MTRRIHHTGLTVADLDRSVAFYRDVLGLGVVMAQEQQGGYFERIVGEHGVDVRMAHLAYVPDGPRIELFEYRSPQGGRHVGRPADVGFAHVCLVVEDGLAELVAEIVAAGGSVISDVVEIDRGANAGGRACYVRDPDGHAIELFTPPPKPPEAVS